MFNALFIVALSFEFSRNSNFITFFNVFLEYVRKFIAYLKIMPLGDIYLLPLSVSIAFVCS